MNLWPHQQQALDFVAETGHCALLGMDMGCLAGDSVVNINRGGNGRRITIRNLVEKESAGWPRGRTRRAGSEIQTMVRCMKADGTLGLAPLVGVKDTGMRLTMRMVLRSGRQLRLTPEHEVCTPKGKVEARTLQVGDSVLIDGNPAFSADRRAKRRPRRDIVTEIARDILSVRVYDLSIGEPAHTYIANGIVVGNTGKSRVVCEIAAKLDRGLGIILCPKSVVPVWEDELAKWAPDVDVLALTRGGGRLKADRTRQFLAATRPGIRVVVLNYESFISKSLSELLLYVQWDLAVCDESHRIKAPSGRTSRTVAKIRAARRLCLTGTPTPHSPLDVFGQARFLSVTHFGLSWTRFRARYAVLERRPGIPVPIVTGHRNLDELERRMARFVFRVTADEVLDLPDREHQRRTVALDPSELTAYVQMEQHLVADVERGEVTASNVLDRLLKLQQITGGTVSQDGRTHRIGRSKQDALCEILEALPPSEKVVVFARFRADLDAINEAAASCNRGVFELSGRTNALGDWKQSHGGVIAIQIQAGGSGISLVEARYCIYYSLGFSLGDFEQSLARCRRPGQTRVVVYIHLAARQTVDEKVYAALASRKNIIEEVLNGITQYQRVAL
jgi:hypothetical protein